MNAEYWRELHAATEDDLAVVNYPSFPPAFNRLVDRLFAGPILSAVSSLTPGRAIEIGCGRGRWLKRLRGRGWTAHGLDIAPAGRPGAVADAARLPVSSGAVDLAMAITVIQHVPDQERSLRELCRIIRPGGALLLVELIDRGGVAWQEHVQPRTITWWRERISSEGFTIEREAPIEYLPLLRLLEWRATHRVADGTRVSPASKMSALRYAGGTAMAWASAILEPIGPLVTPGGASHRLWLARR